MKPKYKVGQLAQLPGIGGGQPTFGHITGLMNRGTSVVYEISGQESLIAEDYIEKVWVQPAPPRKSKSQVDVAATTEDQQTDAVSEGEEFESVDSPFNASSEEYESASEPQ